MVIHGYGIITVRKGDVLSLGELDAQKPREKYSAVLGLTVSDSVLGYEGGIKGVIDTEGNIVIPFRYTSISNASTGLFACFSETDGWKIFAKVTK